MQPKKNKKSSHITIDGEDYEMINVISSNGELVASITSKDIVEKKGLEVKLIKDATKVRFREINQDSNEKKLNELKAKTNDTKKPITGISRIVVETDEKNPQVLAVVTEDDCDCADNLRVRLKYI